MNIRKFLSIAISATFIATFVFAANETVNGQGRYVGRYSKADVSNTIERLEESSDEFRNDFRREINQSNLSSSRKRTYNGYVANCEEAIDQLRKHFDDQNAWWNSRSRVQNTISRSQQVNSMMNELPFRQNLERQWARLRNDINSLADTYDLEGLDGGGWTGGGGGGSGGGWGGGAGGGQTITPPTWAQGTFYGSAAGTPITLTISRNGSVNADIGGQMTYGTFTRGNYLQIAGATSRVTRQGNGILTARTDNGERIAYTRTGWAAVAAVKEDGIPGIRSHHLHGQEEHSSDVLQTAAR